MSNKHVRLNTNQKIEILDKNDTGQFSQPELGEWAKKQFGLDEPLAQQTISNILNNADSIYSTISVIKNTKSLKKPRYPQLDEEVKKFVDDMAELKLQVNRESIIRYIKYISQTKYKIPEGEVSFSAEWLTKVFKRTGLKSRLTHGENASVDVSSDDIQNQLRKIEELLESYDPANIMNFDETGLYYQQPPRRTISSEPLGGLKKSKTRLTVGLLCNSDGSYKGHPIVIGKYKSPKCFKTNAKLLALTAVGRKYEVEYHYSTNSWMTEKIFTSYILKVDRAFGRQGRKIALLLDNASVHKIKATLDKSGIIANFKAHFRSLQYDRALNLYISMNLNNHDVYNMDQVQVMFFLANAYLKVKPETIKNCWSHTNILAFKEGLSCSEVSYPSMPLPLDSDVTSELDSMLPTLPGNYNQEITSVDQLDLEADEHEMLINSTHPSIDSDV
ncbi:DDE-domain-containing protein [Backusella circina FSU 941]|nr:DDE-domain-containing protein [Backusella circina FSU 941]